MFYKLIVAYNGSDFLGYQDNNSGPSIEGALRSALEKILQHSIQLQAASRTDRGVHAEHQVVTFETNKRIKEEQLFISLNQLTPDTIAILTAEEVAPFHPSLDANEKTYTYTIINQPVPSPFHIKRAWHIPQKLNIVSMRKAAQALIGTHDFQAFTQDTYESYIRTLTKLTITENTPFIEVSVTGPAFMYKMVRTLVGTLVAAGKDPSFSVKSVLASKKRADAGICAPPHGLVLKHISY